MNSPILAFAMRAKITGTVAIAAVVLPDGSVGSTRVVQSLDRTFGLDDEALVAARYWLFKPGIVNGQPVPSVVTLLLEFKLH